MQIKSVSVLLFAALASLVAAADKKYVVTYPDNTPQTVIDKAMADVKARGGTITHVYNLIKGFAATMPEESVAAVTAQDVSGYKANIEEDKVVCPLSHLQISRKGSTRAYQSLIGLNNALDPQFRGTGNWRGGLD
ncbi:hypothetical protein RUND412_001736 [Rhizina undulata]